MRVVFPHQSILVLPFQANPKCQIQFDNVQAKMTWLFPLGWHVRIPSKIAGDCSDEIFMRPIPLKQHVTIFLPVVMLPFPPEYVAAACSLPNMMCPFAPKWLRLFHPEREAATIALHVSYSNLDIEPTPIDCCKLPGLTTNKPGSNRIRKKTNKYTFKCKQWQEKISALWNME